MMEKKLNINEWAVEDRPREKMMLHGVGALSDAELLAILIGSGNREETAVELMRRILASCHNDLNELGKMGLEELCTFKGIGDAKAVAILAASELGKRRASAERSRERTTITSSKDIYAYFHPLLCDLSGEECWVLLLNQALKVIDRVRVSTGGLAGTAVDIRLVLREALIRRAPAIALCHNHPSGNTRPSNEDNRLPERLAKRAAVMDIRLIDHLVLTDGAYYSYADEGRI